MQCERLTLAGDPCALARELRALVPAGASVSAPVAEIIARVRSQGDTAVREYTRRLDTGAPSRVRSRSAAPISNRPRAAIDAAVRRGLESAIENVRAVARAAVGDDRVVDLGGHRVVLREAPVQRAGIYVPGGRAPYPSTVVMGVVTASVAGVEEVFVCAPPGAGGEIDQTILGACRLTGASSVYAIGGAQAIAALAYGTETVPAVDVIAGPGNLYVQEAKRQVSGDVGIDGFAGPSDLVVIAGTGAEPEIDRAGSAGSGRARSGNARRGDLVLTGRSWTSSNGDSPPATRRAQSRGWYGRPMPSGRSRWCRPWRRSTSSSSAPTPSGSRHV